jgi:predicted acetyltransferase
MFGRVLPDTRPARADELGSDTVELTVPGGVVAPAARLGPPAADTDGDGDGDGDTDGDGDDLQRRLRDVRDRGVSLALLADGRPPGAGAALGFSPATQALAVEVALPAERRHPLPTPGTVPVRPLEAEEAEARLPGIQERHRRHQIGQVQRSADRWHDWFHDPSAGTRRFLVAGDDGGEGYLSYRVHGSGLVVEDVVTVTDRARRALWDACLDAHAAPALDPGPIDHLTAVNLPADEPLGWRLADGRALRVTGLRPFLHLRLVDVAAALTARRYNASDELVMEVADPTFAANVGRYRLHGSPDGAACIRTQDAPDLTLSAAELAAAYLGGFDLTTLARAGRVVEHRPGRLQRADAMFSWRPGPWTVSDW